MGNQLIRNTEITKDVVGTGGVGGQWIMHKAHRMDKSRANVTVFMFDKKVIQRMTPQDKEEFLSIIRKEPQNLALYQYPGLLTITDPLIERESKLGFVTEQVVNSISSLYQGNQLDLIFPSELETKLHLMDIVECIKYLHYEVRICHLGISPENVYILPDGKWKLGGMAFSVQLNNSMTGEAKVNYEQKGNEIKLNPNINYTAPEVVESGRCTFNSDVFSLACFMYSIYKVKYDKNCGSPNLLNSNSIEGYFRLVQNIEKADYSCIPQPLKNLLLKMLSKDPTNRPTIHDFLNQGWLKDPFVQAFRCLEELPGKDIQQQQSFLKGFSKIFMKYELKFVKKAIFPALNKLMDNVGLASSILPIYFQILQTPEYLNREEQIKIIWKPIRSLLASKEMPGQALHMLIENTQLLFQSFELSELQETFVPVFAKSLGCGVQKIVLSALRKLDFVHKKISVGLLKSTILPKLLNLCLDQAMDMRKYAIIVLSKIYHVFDKSAVNEQILNVLEKLRKMNNNYKINMTILQIFEGMADSLGIETIGNRILVTMIPFLVDRNLTRPEYRAYLQTCKALLHRIEEEQNRRYEGMPDDVPDREDDDEEIPTEASHFRETRSSHRGDFEFLNQVEQGFDFNSFQEGNPNRGSPPQTHSSGRSRENDFTNFDNFGSGSGNNKQKSPQYDRQPQQDMFSDFTNFSGNRQNQQSPPQQINQWEGDRKPETSNFSAVSSISNNYNIEEQKSSNPPTKKQQKPNDHPSDFDMNSAFQSGSNPKNQKQSNINADSFKFETSDTYDMSNIIAPTGGNLQTQSRPQSSNITTQNQPNKRPQQNNQIGFDDFAFPSTTSQPRPQPSNNNYPINNTQPSKSIQPQQNNNWTSQPNVSTNQTKPSPTQNDWFSSIQKPEKPQNPKPNYPTNSKPQTTNLWDVDLDRELQRAPDLGVKPNVRPNQTALSQFMAEPMAPFSNLPQLMSHNDYQYNNQMMQPTGGRYDTSQFDSMAGYDNPKPSTSNQYNQINKSIQSNPANMLLGYPASNYSNANSSQKPNTANTFSFGNSTHKSSNNPFADFQ